MEMLLIFDPSLVTSPTVGSIFLFSIYQSRLYSMDQNGGMYIVTTLVGDLGFLRAIHRATF